MNVMQYAAIAERNWKANLPNFTDFEPKYTFYHDFSIADFCEVYLRDRNAVKKTYNAVVSSWGKNIKAMTEIAMVLNHKSWAFSSNVDSQYLGISKERGLEFSQLYVDLYYKADEFIRKNFKGEDLSYYYMVTD